MKIKKWLPMMMLLFIGLFCFSAYQVISYMRESKARGDLYDGLAAMVESARQEAAQQEPETVTEPQETNDEDVAEPEILPEYRELYEGNSDLVGWICIDDTKINYPVMQTPDDQNFYLHRNFNKDYEVGGCLFVQANCDVFEPTDNVIIYGHNMNDGSMFNNLKKFLSEEYWKQHQYITFDTLYEHHTYQIFAVFTTSATAADGFRYYEFVDACGDAKMFNNYVADCKDIGIYKTGVTPMYGDKMICLSTCEYTHTDGRLVVMAKCIE